MKRFGYSFSVKSVAFFLTLVLFFLALASLARCLLLAEFGAYSGVRDIASSPRVKYDIDEACSAFLENYSLLRSAKSEQDLKDSLDFLYNKNTENLSFSVYDAETGSFIYQNFASPGYSVESSSSGDGVRVVCRLKNPLTARDRYCFTDWFLTKYSLHTGSSVVLTAVYSVLALCCWAFLLFTSGKRKNSAEIADTLAVRIPLEMTLLLSACAALVPAALLWQYGSYENIGHIAVAASSVAVLLVIFILLSMNIAHRLKMRDWWRHTIIYGIIKLLRSFISFLPQEWNSAVVTLGVLGIAAVLAILSVESVFFTVVLVIYLLAAVITACKYAHDYRHVCAEAERIGRGNFSRPIDPGRLWKPVREIARSLGSVENGMSAAVEQRLKSERLKTELITNVSHDLKTPLTSIINYAELLRSEPLPEPASEYAAIIDRKAQRLKKLTDDLVEASKASSGCIKTELQPTDLRELVEQAIGEYSDRLEECGVSPVLMLPQQPVMVLADGRLLWRVIDNLLSNACKYSKTGTRLYIDVTSGRAARAVFKNVSGDMLNIQPYELMERFVRGDASRSNEGSGLGLNIAKNLMELQGGSLMVEIDGDLFKATVKLPSFAAQKEDPDEKSSNR